MVKVMIKRSSSKGQTSQKSRQAEPVRRSRKGVVTSILPRFQGRVRGRARIVLIGGALFFIGTTLGTGLGLLLAPSQPESGVSVVLDPDALDRPNKIKDGPPLPVKTFGSESAKRAYLEDLAETEGTIAPLEALTSSDLKAPAIAALPAPNDPVLGDSQPSAPRQTDSAVKDAWRAYAAPSIPPSGKPRIAIVLDDLGIDQPRSWQAINLASPLTLAILPYGYNLQKMSDAARQNGHEILVHIPMAPMDLGVDPGPNALQKELGPAEILRRLEWDLSQFRGYIGVNNHMGSRFSADAQSMKLVIDALRDRGLAFLDSVTTTGTQGYRIAQEAGIPFARRDVFLDNDTAPEAILKQLREAERVALETGSAIAIGHPRDGTIAALQQWRPQAEARGFEIVPLSALLKVGGPS